jgi:hypothetical protein
MLGIEGGPRLLLFALACIMEWITDRLPTAVDGDMDGDVQIRRAPGTDLFRFVHWSYVGAGVPWQRTVFWQPPAEPAPTEADRIAALEQRVVRLLRAQDELIAAMANRLKALEGVPHDGAIPEGGITALEQRVAADSDRIAALEQRVFGLEVFKRALTEPSPIRINYI